MTEYCSSPFLATFLPAARKTIMIIQIMVPIVLIVAATFKFFSMMKDPEQKNGTKKIINTFVAAVIIYFIPVLVNVVMNLLGNRTSIKKK